MRIGELATACECAVETIRYYEKIELLPKPLRTANGYRSYDEQHRKWLQFILHSKSLGFTQDEVRRLTEIALKPEPPCLDVHSLFSDHVSQVRKKIHDLRKMEKALMRLNMKCENGSLNECPVIDELMS
jgi:MerR family mercuric resistance operon transcriptional regulator